MVIKKLWSGQTGVVNCFGRLKIKYDELISYLNEEHFVEDDPTRTHSGTERYWVFEVADGVALAFKYHDLTEELLVGSNYSLKDPFITLSEFIPIPFEKESGEMWS